MSGLLGGFGETKDANPEVQMLCDKVKPEVEKITGKVYTVFKAVTYRYQVMAGSIYLIKVHVGGSDYLHAKVLQKLDCDGGEIKLLELQQQQKKEDPIVPF